MSKNAGIYAIKNNANGKIYIGSSIDLRMRWNNHKSKLKLGKHDVKEMQMDWDIQKGENFEFVILEKCEPTELSEFETKYIEAYNATEKGYNTNTKKGNELKGYHCRLPQEYIDAIETAATKTNYNKNELSILAYKLMFEHFNIKV